MKTWKSFCLWLRSLVENEHDLDEMEELRREASANTEALLLIYATDSNSAPDGWTVIDHSTDETEELRREME